MDISKIRIKGILIILFSFSIAFAQTWDTQVTYNSNTKNLVIQVFPNYEYMSVYKLSFSKSIINQNSKDSLIAVDNEGERHLYSADLQFQMSERYSSFEYQIDLTENTNVPTNAFLNYGSIKLVNWNELLFECDKDVSMDIVFSIDTIPYELGEAALSDWKKNPTKLLPSKTLVQVNNISIKSNESDESLSDFLESTLDNFDYFEEEDEQELILILGNDSLPTAGVSYNGMTIVYVDSKTSGSNPVLAMQQTIVHELFHNVLPYKIYPEIENRMIDQNWLSEAYPEYLSLKYLLVNEFVRPFDFLSILEQKMRVANEFDDVSLKEMSTEIYRNPNYYEGFYTKGCLAGFLLDLEVYRMSEELITGMDLMEGNYAVLSEEQQVTLNNSIHKMGKDLIQSETQFPYNQYLEEYGILYEKEKYIPDSEKGDLVEVRLENLSFNKKASLEQKALWKSYISNK